MITSKRIFEHRVCYVTSPEDTTVLIAFDIQMESDETIRWFDTIKERRMRVGEIIEDTHEHFIFKRNDHQQKGTYTFMPMTLDIYNEKVKHKILIPKAFADEKEMQRAFEKTKENAW
jgi:hypothetical protein